MSGSGTRRTTILKRRAGQTARLIYYAKKLGLLLVVLGGIAFGFHALTNSIWFNRTEERTITSFHEKLAASGFKTKDLLIDGRDHTSRADLKAALGIQKGESIFAYDLEGMQKKISTLPWVKTATVERLLPDTIYIKLQEREPVALWQRDGKLALVDRGD